MFSFDSQLDQIRQEFEVLKREWKSALNDYYQRKLDQNQPRVPAGSREGGQWSSSGAGAEGFDVRNILEKAKRLLATHAEMGRCVDLCLPLLNRFQAPGSNRNEFDFRKFLNACLGLNR